MINKDIVFTERPSSIPFGYNLSYKSALICLSLKFNCEPRKSCSLIKIQLILTTLILQGNLSNLIKLNTDKSFVFTPIRFDPSINRAITYILKDGLIKKLENGNFRLTELGKEFTKKMIDKKIFAKETNEIINLGVLDDDTLNYIISMWRYDDKD